MGESLDGSEMGCNHPLIVFVFKYCMTRIFAVHILFHLFVWYAACIHLHGVPRHLIWYQATGLPSKISLAQTSWIMPYSGHLWYQSPIARVADSHAYRTLNAVMKYQLVKLLILMKCAFLFGEPGPWTHARCSRTCDPKLDGCYKCGMIEPLERPMTSVERALRIQPHALPMLLCMRIVCLLRTKRITAVPTFVPGPAYFVPQECVWGAIPSSYIVWLSCRNCPETDNTSDPFQSRVSFLST